MNFRTHFPFKPLSSASSKLDPVVRRLARKPAVSGTALSQRDLRRLVAEMID